MSTGLPRPHLARSAHRGRMKLPKPGSQYDAGASVKSAEHNQRRIVNEFYVGTPGALVRATATQGIDSISIRALASVKFR